MLVESGYASLPISAVLLPFNFYIMLVNMTRVCKYRNKYKYTYDAKNQKFTVLKDVPLIPMEIVSCWTGFLGGGTLLVGNVLQVVIMLEVLSLRYAWVIMDQLVAAAVLISIQYFFFFGIAMFNTSKLYSGRPTESEVAGMRRAQYAPWMMLLLRVTASGISIYYDSAVPSVVYNGAVAVLVLLGNMFCTRVQKRVSDVRRKSDASRSNNSTPGTRSSSSSSSPFPVLVRIRRILISASVLGIAWFVWSILTLDKGLVYISADRSNMHHIQDALVQSCITVFMVATTSTHREKFRKWVRLSGATSKNSVSYTSRTASKGLRGSGSYPSSPKPSPVMQPSMKPYHSRPSKSTPSSQFRGPYPSEQPSQAGPSSQSRPSRESTLPLSHASSTSSETFQPSAGYEPSQSSRHSRLSRSSSISQSAEPSPKPRLSVGPER
jgi:hypothetical protein